MRQTTGILSAVVAAGLLPFVFAAPAPVPQLSYAEQPGPIAGVTLNPASATPTGSSSASLYGSEDLLGEVTQPAPVSGGDSAEAPATDIELVNGQEAPQDLGLYLDFNSVDVPQPIRGDGGGFANGPRTYAYEKLNPDLFAPPSTDSAQSGAVPQLQWPMGLSANRFGTGATPGWARQQNTDQLPAATAMAGVDMKLSPYTYRELHWHTANEWSLMLKGSVRLSAVDENGQTFNDDITAGDVWFFPAGVPHSIQALDEGCEFLLVFDDGSFSEDGTFLASELFMRNPKSVLSKNFQAPVSAFENIPNQQLYIFNGQPAPAKFSAQNQTGPAGELPINKSYTYHWSQQEPHTVPGGSVKIVDTSTFPISSDISAALLVIESGAMREMHWHSTSDEWNFFV